MKKKRFLVFLAAGLLASGAVSAEELASDSALMSYRGEELVVTANRVEESKKEVSSSVTIISREQIENSPANDLGELLAEQSIGHIQKYPGTKTTVGIRAFRSDAHGNDLQGKVLVLLNGRRAGTGNLSKIATANVERIEIVKGPAAVQYGSAAMGGVINVITRRGSGKPSLFVEHKTGSFDFKETTGGVSGASNGLDYSATYSFSEMGDYATASGVDYLNTGFDGRESASVHAGYEFSGGQRIGVILHHNSVDVSGSPSYLVRNDLSSYTVESNRSADIVFTAPAGGGLFNWQLRYFFGEDKYGYRSPSSGYSSDTDVEQKGANWQLFYDGDAVDMTAGFDWLHYDLESTLSPKSSSYQNPAVFLLAKTLMFDESLALSGGVRYDSYNVSIHSDEGGDESTDNVTGNAGVAWNATDHVRFRVNYATGFRMPSAGELAGYYPYYGGGFYEGNPDLNPEKSATFEGGINIDSGSFQSSLTYFYSDFTDKIQEKALLSGNRTWENIGGATIAGFEGEFSWGTRFDFVGTNLSVTPFVSFTWLTEYNDDENGDYLLYTPEWNSSAGVRFHESSGFKGAFTVSSFGKTHIQDYVTSWAGSVIRKGSFSVANLMISKTFSLDKPFGKSVTVRGEIENMFDRDYEYVNGYPMPGRSFNLGLRMDI
ncbi:MAG TPA: TonB-dependent receptor [Prosthecochloris aestuarii]|uniref:TonB-dependent receptor n=1 Tax=Prosthecochloris aestuarii TaxID=1102 RepID=A0A831WRB7_PROAE|nr:TonB-dependent receptor [Prosthecochloris aestuarii]